MSAPTTTTPLLETTQAWPLTPLQRAMVYASVVAPNSGVNIEQFVLTLPEAIDESRLLAAWQTIVARHEVLRSRVELPEEGEPLQVVETGTDVDWTSHDWRDLGSCDDQRQRFAEFLALDRRKEFNWNAGPLTRVNCFRMAQERTTIVWTFHHVLLDGRSISRVVREWLAIYESLALEEPVRLLPAGDFATFAQEVSQTPLPHVVEFWRERLLSVAQQTLPQPCSDADASAILAASHGQLTVERDEVATHQLRAFADECGVTMHSLVQAAWALTLNTFTGQTDIVFGSVRACRHVAVPQVESMVGMLINTIPFRVQLDRSMRLDQLLQQIRQQQFDLREYETIGIEDCHRCSGLEADQPLVRTVVMFENVDLQTELQRLGGAWSRRGCELFEKTDVPLTLAVHHDETLSIHLEYSTACYDPQTVQSILTYFVFALDQLRRYASRPIGDFPSVTPAISQRLQSFVAGETKQYRYATLVDCFEATVARDPAAIAIHAGQQQLSFAELNALANTLACRLIERGAKPGEFVGLSLPRSVDLYIAALAILKSGAAYLPLDPQYPQDRLVSMLDDAQPVVVVTESSFAGKLPIDTERLLCVDELPPTESADDANPRVRVAADDPVIAIFTSGTTGRPKGVVLTQRGIAQSNQFMSELLELRPGDRSPQVATINFDVSIEEIFCTLNAGATLVVPPLDVLDSAERFLQFVEQQRLTVLNLSTQLWRELVRYCDDEGREFPDCVRLVIVGGERTPRESYQTWLRVGGRRIRWMNGYGPSEACPMSTVFTPRALGEPLASDPPIGRPIKNWCIYVLDGWQR
ncbi:MAG: AMP-binding protein, partial [Planctomycetaceae bacterium]|nr:AMP-binding protein [Planctomycetaceae bacterium]